MKIVTAPKMRVTETLVVIAIIVVALAQVFADEDEVTAGPIFTTTKKFQLNIKGSNGNSVCKNENGVEGFCVLYTLCNDNKTILLYGDPDENDLRSDEKCSEFHHFCCILEGPWKADEKAREDPGCSTATETDCPWCVALYKDGGNPRFKNPSGLFCGGVLLGPQLILTTASCVAATKHQNVWARLMAEPQHTYNVTAAVTHPKYHSGTRDFDFALLELPEKVTSIKPACVLRQKPRADAICRTFSFDEEDELITTPIKLDSNRCDSEEPDTNGGACGKPVGSNCRITLGSPVICPHQGGYALWGLSRSSCQQGYSFLGYFSTVEGWAKPFLAVKPSEMEEKLKTANKTKK